MHENGELWFTSQWLILLQTCVPSALTFKAGDSHTYVNHAKELGIVQAQELGDYFLFTYMYNDHSFYSLEWILAFASIFCSWSHGLQPKKLQASGAVPQSLSTLLSRRRWALFQTSNVELNESQDKDLYQVQTTFLEGEWADRDQDNLLSLK